jgi:RND family efflux transporter MFP subunit
MSRYTVFALVLALSVSACGKWPGGKNDEAKKEDPPVLIAPEDTIKLQNGELTSGSVITGSIQPERRADLRAEIATVVLKIVRENGERVKRGDLLLVLDDTWIRDSQLSAEAAVRAATQTYEQAERQFERMKTLRDSGMATLVQFEDAENRRNNAQSDLVAAKARAVQARQQLERTEIRAPFDGYVSDRQVSAGDTVQIGKELVKVIDPTSMRFEGYVQADQISSVKVGQRAFFHVNGYGDELFDGVVKRVDPSADPVTRQVQVFVGFTGKDQPKVAGLYAEGRIETGGVDKLMIPESTLARNGDKAYAWRIKGGTLQKVELVLGERDEHTGNHVVRSGLVAGDIVLRDPNSSKPKDGDKVKVTASAVPSVPPNAANAGR